MSLQEIKRVHLTCTFLSSARALCSGAVRAARGTFGGCLTPQQQYASLWLLFLPSPSASRASLKAHPGGERHQAGRNGLWPLLQGPNRGRFSYAKEFFSAITIENNRGGWGVVRVSGRHSIERGYPGSTGLWQGKRKVFINIHTTSPLIQVSQTVTTIKGLQPRGFSLWSFTQRQRNPLIYRNPISLRDFQIPITTTQPFLFFPSFHLISLKCSGAICRP